MKDISLIGFMGCGKSSVGKCLAALLPECRLIDLDTYIEEKEGKNIPEIFNEYGEAAFRRMEREALEEIFSATDRPRTILSLGGGTVTSEPCRQLIRQHTDCFYLRATTDTLLAALKGHSEGRPMLSSAQPIRFDRLSDRSENTSEKSPKDSSDNHPIVTEPCRTTVAEPCRTTVSEPCRTTVTEPCRTTVGEPGRTTVTEPCRTTVTEPCRTTVAEPCRTTVAEPVEAPGKRTSNKKEILRNRIESLMQTRSPQYLDTAHHIIDIDGRTFAQIAAQIKEAVERNAMNIKQ